MSQSLSNEANTTMEAIFERLFEIFSLEYMFSVIMASYFLIKAIDAVNGDKAVPSWVKRLITCFVGAVLFGVFIKFTDVTVQCLIASFFSAVFIYDAAIKEVIKKFNLGYKG